MIFLLFALVVPLVTGLFFLIITLQKSRSLTLLRAIGAPAGVLVRSLLVQVLIIIGGGIVLGTLLFLPLSQTTVGSLALSFDPRGGAPVGRPAPGPGAGERGGRRPPGPGDRPDRGDDRRRGPMKLALRELRRRPGRFVVATAILTLIAVLLMFLGGLLDGLIAGSTGALRAQQADLIVFSSTSEDSLVRSRITPAVREEVEDAVGAERVSGLGSVQLGARVEGRGPRDLVPVVLFGYERAPRGVPDAVPGAGRVYADDSLRADGVREGAVVRLGPARTPVEVIGFLDDSRYSGQGTLWGSLDTWRAVLAANRPAARVGEGVVQALVVHDAAASQAAAIDAATGGATSTLTISEAIDAAAGRLAAADRVQPDHRGHRRDRHRRGGALLRPDHRGAHRAVRRAQGGRGQLGHPLRRRPAAGAGRDARRLGHRRRGLPRARRRSSRRARSPS